jgi:hypothetical protein
VIGCDDHTHDGMIEYLRIQSGALPVTFVISRSVRGKVARLCTGVYQALKVSHADSDISRTNEFMVYSIDVSVVHSGVHPHCSPTTSTWTVLKRYSEFEGLYRSCVGTLAKLPGKKLPGGP